MRWNPLAVNGLIGWEIPRGTAKPLPPAGGKYAPEQPSEFARGGRAY